MSLCQVHNSVGDISHLALNREAGIAAELIASGVTLLGRASYARAGLYGQAFFNLSIGFERTAKLMGALLLRETVI